ncbi:MAG: GAF domain-containing sensor histidine kinase [Actinomycetota bacterium]
MSDVTAPELSPLPTPGAEGAPLAETAAALRWLRAGLSDETMRLELPPDVRSTISPIITALRWGALLYGMVSASTAAANDGDLGVVVTLAIALFLTVWRTFRPLRLAWNDFFGRWLPVIDGVVLGGAVGASDGFDSPFVYCVLVAVGVAAFGWGLRGGLLTLAAALLAMGLVGVATGGPLNMGDVGGVAFLLVLLAIAALVALLRDNLIARQRRTLALSSRLDVLTETNEMLGILNQVARTLPESIDMSEAINATERELRGQFRAETIGLVVRDDATSEWLPMIMEGVEFGDSTLSSDLPEPMQRALLELSTISAGESESALLSPESRSGMYTALRTRGKVIGLLAIENRREGDYDDREIRILDGLAGALALTIDNVRAFGRLRTVGADEERTRIARDLHDRLGQWLTYISLELERIMGEAPGTSSLEGLYGDVQTAIDELRETLRQLRTRVSSEETLALVGSVMADRFGERTGISTSFTATNPGTSLSVTVENELLRILQEALNNVEKHADASRVEVEWSVHDGVGELTVADDGRGFSKGTSSRDASYGLTGMRERAEVIGASLNIETTPGAGTTIRVRASNEMSV